MDNCFSTFLVIYYTKMSEHKKQVILVRTDLNMRKGKMISQGAHASINAYIQSLGRKDWRDISSQWMDQNFTKIVLGVDSDDEILALVLMAQHYDMPYYMVKDRGFTEFNGVETITALGIGPYYSVDIDKLTKKYRLL